MELALYSIVLDFWFYIYHRGCHELDSLWQYHRTHHLTKHPSPLLSSYADSEQEFLEIALIPLLTYGTLKYVFGLPMVRLMVSSNSKSMLIEEQGFHDWWICHEYIIFSEAFGHSGLRVWSTTPSIVSPLLRLLNCELVVEDHDLHHRKGWRKSQNYGKQVRDNADTQYTTILSDMLTLLSCRHGCGIVSSELAASALRLLMPISITPLSSTSHYGEDRPSVCTRI